MRRTSYQVLAASAASFALAFLLPSAPLGGVRGMLVVLPVVAALFASVGRAAARHHASLSTPSTRPSALETALWAGWILLALQHFRLGLPGSSAMVAAAGIVLAGARVGKLALGLYRRIALADLWPFFALPLALYLFAWPWTTMARAPDGDEPYYLLLTHSLAEDGDVDLADDYRDEAWRSFTTVPVAPQPGDPTGPNGEVYSRHSALLPFVLAPLYLLAGPFGAQLGMLALAAAAAAAGLAAARMRYPHRPRGLLAVWMLLAFTPPLLLYAGQFWVEVPAALLTALCLRSLAQLAGSAGAGASPPSRRELFALALPLVALPLLKLRFLAVALPLGALAVARLRSSARRRRELLWLVLATLFALALWNLLRFGNPLRMYAGGDLAILDVPWIDHLRGDLGLFFDLAFGLFALSPIWLLIVPALFLALQQGRLRGSDLSPAPSQGLAELAALVPYIVLIGMRREWYGGWSPPFRYGVVLLPALALLLPALFGTKRPAAPLRWLCSTLAALSAVLALVYLVHPAWTYSLANGSSRLVDELSQAFAVDLARLFPSMVRLRMATWLVPSVVALAALAIGIAGTFTAARPNLEERRRRWRPRSVWPLAAVGLLLLWSGLLLAAARLPTARIEFEDAWMRHRGGALFPERWMVDRTRFDGGWALRPGNEIAARPVAGGTSCSLAIRLASTADRQTSFHLEVRSGDRLVASLPVSGSAGSGLAHRDLPWVEVETGTFAYAAGEELRFRVIAPVAPVAPVAPTPPIPPAPPTPLIIPPADEPRGLLVLDRAEVVWN